MAMYVYYQKIGGNEPWTPIQAQLSLEEIKPTFVTVLATDTIIDESTPNEVKMKAKYQGPMYFDLDSDDIADSIGDAKLLVARLKELELTAADMLIYLSGKKGLHILVPDVCFVAKSGAVQGLVAVYKEMAFQLSVGTMDFRVYTAKRGRQFRTTFNQRENGNWKVQISLEELERLTPESYNQICSAPRGPLPGHNPQWRGRFAIMYDTALQKVAKHKPKASKPTPPHVLAEQLPLFNKLATGSANTAGGFNVIAMQLALYGRESKWDEETLVRACRGVIENHQSDGSRYNSARRREAELRRMFYYLEDNPSFEYSAAGIKSCFPKQAPTTQSVDGPWEGDPDSYPEAADEEQAHFAGVYAGTSMYLVSKGEDGDVPISNFVLRKAEIMRELDTELILSAKCLVVVNGKPAGYVFFQPASFTSGSALQNAVANLGASFSGTDIHARGVFQAMLREIDKDSYVVTSEGVNMLSLGKGSKERKEFVVWADKEGIRCAASFTEAGYSVAFQGFPDPRGNIQTDILGVTPLDDLLAEPGGRDRFINCIHSLINAHSAEVMGKLLGWGAATFYAPLFQHRLSKFPLLHVYGPAGNGKTETVMGLLRMFYNKAEAASATPNSSPFAISQLFGSSSSIPVVLDEYKPHVMDRQKLDNMRSMLRDVYNAKEMQRGGGNRSSNHFGALSSVKLSAPVVFIAEAPETETAIVERSVMVSFRRLTGRQQVNAYRSAMKFYQDTLPLTSLGLEIATTVVAENDATASLQSFNKAFAWATEKFLAAPDDADKVLAGEMTPEEAKLRASMRPRTIFNNSVAFFGLTVVKRILIEKLGIDTFKEKFEETFTSMAKNVFVGVEAMVSASLPEYVKVLTVMAEMSRMDATEQFALRENVDYNLSEVGGRAVITLLATQCYRRYRAFIRSTGGVALYPSEESFQASLREIPQFVQMGSGTRKVDGSTTVLFSDELVIAGVPLWKGKVISMTL